MYINVSWKNAFVIHNQQEGIVIDGRRLVVMEALERKKAQELTSKESKVKEDKRNLHLVREGSKW